MAGTIAGARDVLHLGRGTDYPLALGGALKLKEIRYIHAEGYAAGEMKHGPIALIDENVPVIVIAPTGPLFDKTVSNMQEVQARGGKVVLISDYDGVQAAGENCMATITMPKVHPLIAPLVYAVPVQLLAFMCGGQGDGCRSAAEFGEECYGGVRGGRGCIIPVACRSRARCALRSSIVRLPDRCSIRWQLEQTAARSSIFVFAPGSRRATGTL